MTESDIFDALDWGLVEALALAPRIPFRRVAEVLGISDQTAARRYQRLRDEAGLRVVARLDPGKSGGTEWFLRLHCSPDIAASVATALAVRHDTSWVELVSGGTEVVCVVRSPGGDAGPVLVERLASGRGLLGINAHAILHKFSPPVPPVLRGHLSEEQLTYLKPYTVVESQGGPPAEIDEIDRKMLAVLGKDGRAPAAHLAASARCHESRIRRRIEQLQRAGQLIFELDIEPRKVMVALIWASVVPTELAKVGKALASDAHIAFAAATTGPTNLMASVLAESPEELYQFLTRNVGGRPGIQGVETTPITRIVKRHSSSS